MIRIDGQSIAGDLNSIAAGRECISEQDLEDIATQLKALAAWQDPDVSSAMFEKELYWEHLEPLTCPGCGAQCYFKWKVLNRHSHPECGHTWMETPWRSLWVNLLRILGPTPGHIKISNVISFTLFYPLHLIVYIVSIARRGSQNETDDGTDGERAQAPAPQTASHEAPLGGAPGQATCHVIDCDDEPDAGNLVIAKHEQGGQLSWDPGRVDFFLSPEQKAGNLTGWELLPKLDGKPVLNACVLDHLLEHPELIPEEWKTNYVYFWGTIYTYPDRMLEFIRGQGRITGRLQFVRCLRWEENGWTSDYENLDAVWCSQCPAAILRS